MAGANIVINQTGLPAGIAGRSRDDIVISTVVTLTNDDDSGVTSWRWELIDQPDLSPPVSLVNPNSSTCTFTPNASGGTYLIQLSVNGGGEGQVDRILVVIRDTDGNRYPAWQETDEANWIDTETSLPNERGWWPDLRRLINSAAASGDVCCLCTYGVSAVGAVDPCPYSSIQDAIDAAFTDGGGLVVVRPGTYVEDITAKAGVHVRGWTASDLGGEPLGAQAPLLQGLIFIDLSADGYFTWRGVDVDGGGNGAISFEGANYQAATFVECRIDGGIAEDPGVSVTASNTGTSGSRASTLRFNRCYLSAQASTTSSANVVSCADGIVEFRECVLVGEEATTSDERNAIDAYDNGTVSLYRTDITGRTLIETGGAMFAQSSSFTGGAFGGSQDEAIHLQTGAGALMYDCRLATSGPPYGTAGIEGSGVVIHDLLTMLGVEQEVFASTISASPVSAAPPRFHSQPLVHTGTQGSIATFGPSGAGTRFMYIPAKDGALRAGAVSGTQWDNASIGSGSLAVGSSNTASGSQSVSLGSNSTASGAQAATLGSNNTASGAQSLALGLNSTATAGQAVAMGLKAMADQFSAVAVSSSYHTYSSVDYPAQLMLLVLSRESGAAGQYELTLDGSSPNGTTKPSSNRIIMNTKTCYAIWGMICGTCPDVGSYASFLIWGHARYTSSGAELVSAGGMVIAASDTAWEATIDVDATNKIIKVLGTTPEDDPVFWTGFVITVPVPDEIPP